ncbi:MAG: zf-HC2 domain-containing protein [Dehalococcoidia bacterium]
MTFVTLFRPHDRSRRLLDAFVDGELFGRPAARFEAHLARCGRCSRDVAAARQLKRSLRAMPERDAPRSFQLTPAMAAAASGARPAEARGPARVFARPLQFAAAAAVATLAVVVAVDVWPSGGGDTDATQASTAPELAAAQAAAASTPEAAVKAEVSATASARALSTPRGGGASAASAGEATPATRDDGPPAADATAVGLTDSADPSADDHLAASADSPSASSSYAAPAGAEGSAQAPSDDGGLSATRLLELGLVALLAALVALMLVSRRRTRRA